MNQQDRARMARLYTYMGRWPWWNRGHTTTPADLSKFASNMEELQSLFMQAVIAIARPDAEDPDLDLDDLEAALKAMEVDDD